MKTVIRRGVFETNSSSVHTLTLDKSGLEKPDMRIYKRKNKEGETKRYIYVPLQYFGKDIVTYKSQRDKLSYLLTTAYVHSGSDLEDFMDSYAFKDIERDIVDYYKECGKETDGIMILSESEKNAGLDHQSYYDYEYIEDFPLSVVDFVFNRYIALHTDCD